MIRAALAKAIYMVAIVFALNSLALSFVAETLNDFADDLEDDA